MSNTDPSPAFLSGAPLSKPTSARALLADPGKHWRRGYSAYELAHSWLAAGDVPDDVRRVLDTNTVYRGCRLVEALVERKVELGTPGRPSQTDLMALVQLRSGRNAVIAVEGKARETFGPLVSEWNTSVGKATRLTDLCRQLELPLAGASKLRYQLLHRTVSALREARRYGAREAMTLVHSFDSADGSLGDFDAFARSLGMRDAAANGVTTGVKRGDVTLRLAWVRSALT
jgi:hypothetical protein